MARFAFSSVALLLFALVATDLGLGAAKKNADSNCMSQLLQSYGIPGKRATAYAQRMAKVKFDEASLRFSAKHAFLHFSLKTFGITGNDLALIKACVHSGLNGKPRSCKKTPCGAHGSCIFSAKSQRKYICDCKAGYSGKRCDKDVCSPNPCRNKGTCYHTTNGFLCDCKKGYLGQTCNITVNECRSSPCQNGGTCRDGVLKYTCTCPTGYKGINCETKWLDANEYKTLQQTVKQQQVVIKKLQADIRNPVNFLKCVSSRGVINWKQRAINKLDSHTDNGQLVSMTFKKQREDTHLRLTFSSNLRQFYYRRCSQWYFLIDGRHCSNPAPINGRLFQGITSGHHNYDHRHSTILGVCRGTSAGSIRSGNHQITMNVRGCPGQTQGDAHTGWGTTTIMLVEELCPPQ